MIEDDASGVTEMKSNALRTAIMRIMSEMFDGVDEHGIYPTGQFMDRIEALLESMMAAPEVMHLSGSEALYGFTTWLTCRDQVVTESAKHDVAAWAELVGEFCRINHLHEPRAEWVTLLTHPTKKAA